MVGLIALQYQWQIQSAKREKQDIFFYCRAGLTKLMGRCVGVCA